MGVMWHPGGVSPERRLYPFLEVAATWKGLCLLHETPARTASFARRFPDLTLYPAGWHRRVATLRGFGERLV